MRRPLGSLAVLTCFSIVFAILCDPPALARADTPDPANAPDPALQSYLSANGMLNRGLYELAAAEYRKFLSSHDDHERAPVARYGLGVCLFRMGQYDAAVETLTLLQERPQFEFAAEVGTILGQCHLQEHRYAEAAEAFKRVVRNSREHDLADDAAAGWVEALYLNGQYENAANQGESFMDRWPESPLRERVGFFWGTAVMARHDYAAAVERFAELLERFPKGSFAEQASLLLAQCHQHDNAVDEAIRQYQRVLKQAGNRYIPEALLGLATLLQRLDKPGEAGALLDQLLERFPKSPLRYTARFQRGRAWFDQGRLDRAAPMFQQVAGDKGELRDEAAYWAAKCKLRGGEFDEAARRLTDAIEAFPESDLIAEMFYDRAIALVRTGRYDDSIKALIAFQSRFPEHALAPDTLQLLAATEHQHHRYDESLKHSREFLKQYPSHKLAPTVAFLSAENDFLAGRYEQAAQSYQRFLLQHPDDPQSIKARFRLGTALYRLQRFDEAEDFLEEVTNGAGMDETYRPALLALGDIHFQRGEWKQAQRHLNEYLSVGLDVPSADDALLKLGLARQRQGDNEKALDAYSQLIDRFEESPHRLQAMFERGQALVALGRLDDAVKAFKAVVDEDDDSRFAPYALNHLAVIAVQRKHFDKAAKLYESVGSTDADTQLKADALFQNSQALMADGQFQAAEAAFGRFINQYPSHARATEARAQLAIAMARQDRHSDAVKAISEIERSAGSGSGEDVMLAPSLRAALRYEKAWCLRELGRSNEAAEAYGTLLDEGLPGDFNAHAILELTGIQVGARRFEEAATLLRRLQQSMEADSAIVPAQVREQATYRLGLCEFELKRFREAADLFEEFIDAFPKSPLLASASFYCGEALFTLARHEQAVTHLARVADKFDDDPVFGPSLLRLGESLAALQRWALSERVFTEYLDRFDESEHRFQAHFGVGWAREHQKRYDEAMSAYRQVTARHQGPTAARAQFQIGECLFAKKQYEAAARELLKVDILFAYPEWSAAALYEAGRCFEKLGKPVEARRHFKQVTEQHTETRWAEMALQRLSGLSSADLPGR